MDTINHLIPIAMLIGTIGITIAVIAGIVMGIVDAMRDRKKPTVIVIQVDENGKVIHTRSMGNVEGKKLIEG